MVDCGPARIVIVDIASYYVVTGALGRLELTYCLLRFADYGCAGSELVGCLELEQPEAGTILRCLRGC